jgi:hypothetical protein
MFNLPGEINVGTNSTVGLIVDEKLLEQLQAGYRGIAWRRCAAPLMRSCYHYDTSQISKSRIRVDCNCRIIMAPTRRARSYPKAGVSFALLRSASALKTTASVGSTARALKCHW